MADYSSVLFTNISDLDSGKSTASSNAANSGDSVAFRLRDFNNIEGNIVFDVDGTTGQTSSPDCDGGGQNNGDSGDAVLFSGGDSDNNTISGNTFYDFDGGDGTYQTSINGMLGGSVKSTLDDYNNFTNNTRLIVTGKQNRKKYYHL